MSALEEMTYDVDLGTVSGKVTVDELVQGRYKFTVANGSSIDFSFSGYCLEVCDESGVGIAGIIGEDINEDFSLKNVTLKAGTYYFNYGFNPEDSGIPSLTLDVTDTYVLADDDYENNNDLGVISGSKTISANINVTGDDDGYSFTTGKAGYVTLSIGTDVPVCGFYVYPIDPETGDITDEMRVQYYDGAGSKSISFYSEVGVTYNVDYLWGATSLEWADYAPMGEYTFSINVTDTLPADCNDGENGNDSFANATDIVLNSDSYGDFYGYAFGMNFHTANDVDYYKFTLDSSAEIYIGTWSEFLDPDTEMWLYDAQGNQITYNDDYSTGDYEYKSAYIVTNLVAGDYYVMVSGKGKIITDYMLDVSGNYTAGDTPDVPEIVEDVCEPNDDFANAKEIVLDEDGFGIAEDLTIHSAEDEDYFKFTLAEDSQVTLTTSGSEGGDTNITLYNEDFSQIDIDDDSGDILYSSLTKALEAGTYYVKVDTYEDAPLDNYSLSIQAAVSDIPDTPDVPEVSADEFEPNDNFANAQEIVLDEDGYGVAENLTFHSETDVDYFKFTLTETSNVSVWHYTNQDAAINYSIYDSNYDLVGGSADVNTLAAGTYYIRAKADDTLVEDYSVIVEAYAVEPDVPEVSADEFEPNDNFANAQEITLDEDGYGIADDLTFHAADDVDYFKFTLEEDSTVSVTYSVYHGSGVEVNYSIYDSNYNLVDEADTLSAGTYYIKTEADGGAILDYYSLEVYSEAATVEPDVPDNPDMPKSEITLVDGKFSAENLSSGTYTITLEEDGVLNISGFEDSFGTITMCEPAGKALVGGDTQKDGNLSLTEIALSAGTYELEVYAQGGAMNDVEISFKAKELPTPDQYENNCDLGTISNSETIITANIDTSLDRDAYCFTTGKAGYVTVTINANAKEYGFEANSFDSEEGYVPEGYSEYYNGKGNNSVTFYSEAGVEHWIENLYGYASPEGGNLAPMGDYTLTINVSDICPEDYKEGTNGNDTRANAAVITIETYGDNNEYFDEYVSGVNFHTTDDVDYYKFTLDSSAEIYIEAWNEYSYSDTEMGLFDSDGKLITHSDNDVGYEYIEANLAAGDYYVMVSGKGEIITDYTLNVYGEYTSGDTPDLPDSPDVPDVPEIVEDACEPNDDFANAQEIVLDDDGYGIAQNLSIHSAEDEDYFKFTLEEYSQVTLTTSGSAGGDTNIRLYDGYYNEICYDDDGGEGYYSILNKTLAAGTYYVKVDTYGDAPLDNYSLSVDTQVIIPVTEDSYEPNNVREQAANITLEDMQTDDGTIFSVAILENLTWHEVHEFEDPDWFKFTLTEASSVYISIYGEEFDGYTDLSLQDADGHFYWDSNNSRNEDEYRYISKTLDAGTYYIRTDGWNYDYPGWQYGLKIAAFTDVDEDEYESGNDSISSAPEFGFDEYDCLTVEGSLHTADDVDYYKFTVAENEEFVYKFAWDVSNENDLVGRDITDMQGNYVEYNNFIALNTGDYCIRVAGDSPAAGYEVQLQRYAVTDLGTITNEGLTATLEGDGTSQYYKFTLSETGFIKLEQNYWDAYIYDKNGNRVFENSVSAAGDYYVVYYGDYSNTIFITSQTFEDLGTLGKSSTALTLEGVIEGSDSYNDYKYNYYSFTLKDDGFITLESLLNTENYHDRVAIEVISSTGEQYLLSADNQDNTSDATRLTAGEYFVTVRGEGSPDDPSDEFNFKLSYSANTPKPDVYEVNDSEDTAYNLGNLTSKKSIDLDLTLDYKEDVDYFKFTLSQDGYVNLQLTGNESNYNANVYYELWSTGDEEEGEYPEGEDIWWGEMGEYAGYRTSGKYFLKAGEYCVRIEGDYYDYYNDVVDYGFKATYSTTANKDAYEANDTISTAKNIGTISSSGGQIRKNNLNFHYDMDIDHYKFTLANDEVIWVQAIGTFPMIYSPELYDGEGGFLNMGEYNRYFFSFDAGTHTIGLADAFPGYGYYVSDGYDLIIKTLAYSDKTVSGTGNTIGVFTTGNVTVNAGAKLATEEYAAITVVAENYLAGDEYAAEEEPIAEPFATVTLKNNSSVSNSYEGMSYINTAIWAVGGYYDDTPGTARIVFDGNNISVNATGDGVAAIGATDSDLELVFSENAADSSNVKITANGNDTAVAISVQGFESNYNLTITGSFGGTIISSESNDFAAYPASRAIIADNLLVTGDLAGTIVIWSDVGLENTPGHSCSNVYGIESFGDFTVEGEISGTIAAASNCLITVNDDDDIYYELYVTAIQAESINASISGTIFAGNINTDMSRETFMAKLANPANAANKKLLQDSSRDFYAIEGGTSNIEFTDTATVWGNIYVGGGSTITVSSQAEIFGDVGFGESYGYGKAVEEGTDTESNELIFVLDKVANDKTFTISGRIVDGGDDENGYFESYVDVITIDATNAVGGTYKLAEGWSWDNNSELRIIRGEEELYLDYYYITDSGDCVFRFEEDMQITITANSGLTLNISDDLKAPELTGELNAKASVTNYNAVLSWNANAFYDAKGVTGYRVSVYDYDGEQVSSTEVTTASLSLKDLAVGEYSFAVQARDAAGNWSEAFDTDFTVKDVTDPVFGDVKADIDESENTVTLYWDAKDNVGVTEYTVEYSRNSNFTDAVSISPEGSSASITDLDEAVTYYYRINAKDAAGNTSSKIGSFVLADDTAPDAVGNVNAAVKDYTANLSWDAAADNVDVTKYIVDYKLADSENWQTKEVSNCELTLSNLAVGSYEYMVMAEDAAGNAGEWSDVGQFEIKDVTKPVFNSTPTAKVEGGNVTISWQPATDNVGIEKYRIEYGVKGGEYTNFVGVEGSAAVATLTDLQDATNYIFRVIAIDAAGNETRTVEKTFYIADATPPELPEIPFIDISTADNNAYISWQPAIDNVGIAKYIVKYTKDGKEKSIETSDTFIDLSALANGDYTLEIIAVDAAGNKTPYPENSFTIDYIAPDRFEGNDSMEKATLLTFKNGSGEWKNLTIDVKDDVDYYRFTIDKYSHVIVNVDGVRQTVLNEAGEDASYTDGKWKPGLAAGTYFVKVEGERIEDYTLTIDVAELVLPTAIEPSMPPLVDPANILLSGKIIVGETAEGTAAKTFAFEDISGGSVVVYSARNQVAYDVTATDKNDAANTATVTDTVAAAENVAKSVLVKAEEDNVLDIFFAEATGKWSSGYVARHVGTLGGWEGTGEEVNLNGKNKITDIFQGSGDDNILVLSDDVQGDALFVDDIYSATPNASFNNQSRLENLKEILAGAGNDVIDMTSDDMAYTGEGVTVRGGDGKDVIWAYSGNNKLFGDDGDDKIIGAAGNDLIVGGLGNDILHGGGGDDIFAFGVDENGNGFGNDTITQREGGRVTLWFAEGTAVTPVEENKLYTYGNGCSIKIEGDCLVTIAMGDELEAFAADKEDAFAGKTSTTIFKELA